MRFASLAAAILLWPLAVLSAQAEDAPFYIDEVRFGGTSLDFAFETSFDYYVYYRTGVNGEVLFQELDFGAAGYEPGSLVYNLLTPRPHVGTTISLDEDGTSSIYAGLTWHQELGSVFFIEGSFGAAIHNGKMDEYEFLRPGKVYRGLGSPILFRESFAIGASVTENLNVIVQLSHMSHAGLAGEANAGQTDLAVKLGWEF